jgi:hypothetical protein
MGRQPRLWWVNLVTGQQTEVHINCPLVTAIPLGEFALSPDGRYLAIGGTEGNALENGAQAWYFADLNTGTSTKVASGLGPTPSGWVQTPSGMRAILSTGSPDEDDYVALPSKLVDPATCTMSPLQPGTTGDPHLSPDERVLMQVTPNVSLDIHDQQSGKTRTLKFSDYDNKYAVDVNFTWLDSRFIQLNGKRTAFVDTATMKVGYMPDYPAAENKAVQYSRGFKWAIVQGPSDISIGRVEAPPAAASH